MDKIKKPVELIHSISIENTDRVKDEEYIGHLAAIVESSDDAIISKALDGTIKSWNKGSEKMFGYTAKEAVGKHISLIVPTEYINEEMKILERIRNNEIIDQYETVRKKKSGEEFHVSLTVSPLKDRVGSIIGISKIVRDITARKKSDAELIRANKELIFQNQEKEKRAAELIVANKELAFQNQEKEKRAAELIIANKELLFQNEEKEKRAAELIIANKELLFQNEEKEKRAAELIIANKELLFQNEEKEKRAAELIIANKELLFQNNEKEKRAAELIVANKELAFQNEEKEKRAAELIIANKELVFQNKEKEKRAAELIIANKELLFQNEEKEKRAAELIVANNELAFQNEEKEKRAAELIIANKELAFQNEEKEKRAAELIVANKELAFQNEEKEKRAVKLSIANKELEQFAYIASHDLQEPLRTVSNYMRVFEEDYITLLDGNARKYLVSVNSAIKRMSILIKSLLDFSRLGLNKKLIYVDCKKLIEDVIADLDTIIKSSDVIIEVTEMPSLNVYETEIRQVFQNLITNAIKFQRKHTQPVIKIRSKKINDQWQFSVNDNGIGIAPVHFERIFDIFQRLHNTAEYEGNGIGLANCKKIVQLHQGEIWVESNPGQGTTFYFTIPNLTI